MLKHPQTANRTYAAFALQSIQPGDRITIDSLLKAFEQDSHSSVKEAAVQGLAANSQGERYVINALFDSVKSRDEDAVRSLAASAIGRISSRHPGLLNDSDIQVLLEIIQNNQEDMRVIGNCIEAIDQSGLSDEKTLESLIQAFQYQDEYVNEQASIALARLSEQIFAQTQTFNQIKPNKEKLFKALEALNALNATDSLAIGEARQKIEATLENFELKRRTLILESTQRWLIGNRAVWILHPLIWIALILAYPSSRQIQAFFFWNKHVRAVLGCWYVGPLISAVAPLRQRLFAPFKDSLLADAKLNFFEPQAYFADSNVQLKGGKTVQALTEVLPAIKGQIIIEGESGLGKTMLLRHLVSQTKRVIVFLPAHKCENGVIEAIQAKLHGQAQDADFLRHLIYSLSIRQKYVEALQGGEVGRHL